MVASYLGTGLVVASIFFLLRPKEYDEIVTTEWNDVITAIMLWPALVTMLIWFSFDALIDWLDQDED